MAVQLSRVCVALVVLLFLTLEVACGLNSKRSPRFQPMLPPLGQKDQRNAAPMPSSLLEGHVALLKRDHSSQTPVMAPIPSASPPCAATGCLEWCCTAEQSCCLNGCMPNDGSVCWDTGYCAAGWDPCGVGACYPTGVGATCCSTAGGVYCEAGYECVGSIITGYSCSAVAGGAVGNSTTPTPTTSPSTVPPTPDTTTPAQTTPLPPATTTTNAVSVPPTTTVVEATVLTSGATIGSSIVQNPTTVETTAIVPVTTSVAAASPSTSSNTSSSSGQRTVVWGVQVLGWAGVGMVFVSYLAASF